MARLVICVYAFVFSSVFSQAFAVDAFPVELFTVRSEPVVSKKTAVGIIEAKDTYSAGFREGGQIVEITVDVGDVLKSGDVVARLDANQAEQALRAARATLNASEASLLYANQVLEREARLLTQGNTTQSSVDSATQSQLVAQSTRDQAKSQLDVKQREANDMVLYAVQDSIVTEKLVDVGQVVSASDAIVTLAGTTGREAVFPAANVPGIGSILGNSVAISTIGGEDRPSATITEVSPLVESYGTVEVKAELLDEIFLKDAIGTPIVGEVEFTNPPSITIPWSALTSDASGPAVWVVSESDMKAERRSISVARYMEGLVDVSAGLESGEKIVAYGAHQMFEGRVVFDAVGDLAE